MRLTDGSRVLIIGAGPSGSFTALHLLRQAAAASLQLDVTLFEARDFNRPGPGGCNKCAGILSAGFIHGMARLGLHLPPEVIQAQFDTYILHLGPRAGASAAGNGSSAGPSPASAGLPARAAFPASLPIHLPGLDRKITSIYRGGGPRLGSQPAPRSFDDWLLGQALAAGAHLVRARVRAVRAGPPPRVVTAHQEYEADLVVLASGINSQVQLDPAWGYQPPRTEVMAQDEIPLPDEAWDGNVHVFFDQPAGLLFGGLIPKGRYVNVSLLGRSLPSDAVDQFFAGAGIASLLPVKPASLCGCTPSVAVSPARNYFGDRFVAVGDAAVTRLYKDGLGSAFITAEAAARSAVERGVSARDFAAGYRPACRRIAWDNQYGRLLFWLWMLTNRTPLLRRAWAQAILDEASRPAARRSHTSVLWGMLTGDEAYRKLFWRSVSLPSLAGLLAGALKKNGRGS